MVTTIQCQHETMIDQAGRFGVCKKCGREVEYPVERNGEIRVIKEGRMVEERPKRGAVPRSKFTKKQRLEITAEAESEGAIPTATKYGIPITTLRGWLKRYKHRVDGQMANIAASCHEEELVSKRLWHVGVIVTTTMRSVHEIEVYLEALQGIARRVDRFSNRDSMQPWVEGQIVALEWVLNKSEGTITKG